MSKPKSPWLSFDSSLSATDGPIVRINDDRMVAFEQYWVGDTLIVRWMQIPPLPEEER